MALSWKKPQLTAEINVIGTINVLEALRTAEKQDIRTILIGSGEEYGYTEEYFKGLTAEQRVMKYRKGQAMYAWELKNKWYHRNEPLDIRNYATAALEIANPPLEGMQQRRSGTKRRRQRSSGIR